jgi:lauroyl/myristoyl acyltransferase
MANAKIPESAARSIIGVELQRIIAEAQRGQLQTFLIHFAVWEILGMANVKIRKHVARRVDSAELQWNIVEQRYRRLQKIQL